MRILLTEGSSLSARQTLTALGLQGYCIDVLDSQPLTCLARFSRFTRRCIPVPSFGRAPQAYLNALIHELKRTKYDVLLPTHDQVYLVSRFQDRLHHYVKLAVPPWEAIQALQSKVKLHQTLERYGLPQPETALLRSVEEIAPHGSYPYFLKLPYSTAGQGVWKVTSDAERTAACQNLAPHAEAIAQEGLLLQRLATGDLCVAQSVFDQGKMIACHTYQARQLGVGGSACARFSVHHPVVQKHVAQLGEQLAWHGALMLDYLYDDQRGPSYIDANPRIGETYNAFLSGVPLCEMLVDVSLGKPVLPCPQAKVGVKSHSSMMCLMAQMIQQPSRMHLLHELKQVLLKRGVYAQSMDEITLSCIDARSLVPAIYVLAQLLASPRNAQRLTTMTVQNYSLDAQTVKLIAAIQS